MKSILKYGLYSLLIANTLWISSCKKEQESTQNSSSTIADTQEKLANDPLINDVGNNPSSYQTDGVFDLEKFEQKISSPQDLEQYNKLKSSAQIQTLHTKVAQTLSILSIRKGLSETSSSDELAQAVTDSYIDNMSEAGVEDVVEKKTKDITTDFQSYSEEVANAISERYANSSVTTQEVSETFSTEYTNKMRKKILDIQNGIRFDYQLNEEQKDKLLFATISLYATIGSVSKYWTSVASKSDDSLIEQSVSKFRTLGFWKKVGNFIKKNAVAIVVTAVVVVAVAVVIAPAAVAIATAAGGLSSFGSGAVAAAAAGDALVLAWGATGVGIYQTWKTWGRKTW